MKRSIFSVLGIAVIMACLTLISCDNQSCQDVVCGFNEECHSGTCYCVSGYEGDNCDIISADKYIGSYTVTEFCFNGNGNSGYSVQIGYGFEINEIQITNFLNQGITVTAQLGTDFSNGQEGNYLFIPNQQQGAIEVQGEGNYFPDQGRIVFHTVSIVQSGQHRECEITLFR